MAEKLPTGELYLQKNKGDIEKVSITDISTRKDFINEVKCLFKKAGYKKEDYKKAIYKTNNSIKYKTLIAKIGG